MCWPRAKAGAPKREPCAGKSWLACCVSCEPCSAFRFLHLQLPDEGQAVTRQSFQFRVDRAKLIAAELQDGHYLLRSNLVGENPAVLWERYVQLAQIEAAFKAMKSELGIRPLYHQLGRTTLPCASRLLVSMAFP